MFEHIAKLACRCGNCWALRQAVGITAKMPAQPPLGFGTGILRASLVHVIVMHCLAIPRIYVVSGLGSEPATSVQAELHDLASSDVGWHLHATRSVPVVKHGIGLEFLYDKHAARATDDFGEMGQAHGPAGIPADDAACGDCSSSIGGGRVRGSTGDGVGSHGLCPFCSASPLIEYIMACTSVYPTMIFGRTRYLHNDARKKMPHGTYPFGYSSGAFGHVRIGTLSGDYAYCTMLLTVS